MTMTEARPEERVTTANPVPPTPDPPTPDPVGEAVFDSADHKVIGLVFIAVSLLFFVVLRGIGSALGVDAVSAGSGIVGEEGLRLTSLYETGIVMLWAAPLWMGLATYLLPLQIGATRLAFPRLQALALWTHVGGAGLFVAGHLMDRPPGVGLSGREPLQAPIIGAINPGTNLFLASFLLLGLATLLASGNLLATALTMRTDGMTLGRMPLFSWGVVAAAAGSLLATPVFLASSFLLYLDMHFDGTSLFVPGEAADLVWQKGLWLYGRPEALLLLVPALGAACDIVVTAARRSLVGPPPAPLPPAIKAKIPAHSPLVSPPSGHVLAAGALFGLAGFALLTWAQDKSGLHAVILPAAGVATALFGCAAGVLLLLWLNTLRQAKVTPSLGLGFVFAAVLVGLAAAANAALAAVVGASGSALGQGMIDLITVGVPTIVGFGALYHWAKKLFGVELSRPLGGLVLLASLGGTLALGVGHSIAGYAGADAYAESVTGDAKTGFVLAQAGHVVLLVAGVLIALDVARALAMGRRHSPTPADLHDGVTLEWAAASPPSAQGFAQLPEVRSAAPLADLAPPQSTKRKG